MSGSDARATKELDARLKADIDLFRHVKVRVHDGVAHLTGFVYSTDALYRVKQLASDSPGITSVDDQVRLERNGTHNSGGGD